MSLENLPVPGSQPDEQSVSDGDGRDSLDLASESEAVGSQAGDMARIMGMLTRLTARVEAIDARSRSSGDSGGLESALDRISGLSAPPRHTRSGSPSLKSILRQSTVELPAPDLLSRLHCGPDATVVVAKADLDNFYHRLRLPVWMRPYFALPPVRAGEVGVGDEFGGSKDRSRSGDPSIKSGGTLQRDISRTRSDQTWPTPPPGHTRTHLR